jgi:hypothetical protein
MILLTNLLPLFLSSPHSQTNPSLSVKATTNISESINMIGNITSIGAWAPSQYPLNDLQNIEQINAIGQLIHQGFDEYYFVMRDYTNGTETRETEALLNSADKTDLKIFVILLPPSEGGTQANYNWKGWVNYFNHLKSKHRSFEGFVMDDFNATSGERRTYMMNNIYIMKLSGLEDALKYKREDVEFYPVMYLENSGFKTLKNKYNPYMTGVLLVSTEYQNVSTLAENTKTVLEMFHEDTEVPKSFKYIIYPFKSGDTRPTDHLIAQTISITSKIVDGLIFYVYTEHPIIQNFLRNGSQYELTGIIYNVY